MYSKLMVQHKLKIYFPRNQTVAVEVGGETYYDSDDDNDDDDDDSDDDDDDDDNVDRDDDQMIMMIRMRVLFLMKMV